MQRAFRFPHPLSTYIAAVVVTVMAWAPATLFAEEPVYAKHGMVSSQEAVATQVGVDILRRGGNAVDAAVAVGFALSVTLPRAGNLGGGGFMLVHLGASGETVAIDYRETAPAGATRDMYLDAAGDVDKQRSRFSHFSAGTPGTVAGLAMALERYGTMSLAQVVQPALQLARHGVEVTPALADSLNERRERLSGNAAAKAIFVKPDGSDWQPGERLVQSDLAGTLAAILSSGARTFYQGETARLIAEDMAAHGGLMSTKDLAAYRPVLREPIVGQYRGYEIHSMPPPSSGGVHLVQILNLLEPYPITQLGANSPETIHLMAEAMRLAYADRSEHLGDPGYWRVPVRGLISKEYADALRPLIDHERAGDSAKVRPGEPLAYESNETTHFSVMDGHGNAVTNTYTINFSYGSGIVAAGTGVLMNNEMDDFSAKPGVPNAYGLIGGDANAVEAGKRPLSSMTPTLLLKDDQPILATGSPGGSRIITTTLQVIMNIVDHGMNVAEASAASRIHHQWWPDEIRIESTLDPETIKALEALGHTVVEKAPMGSTQSIMRGPEGFHGASDPRRAGALTAGY